ncbi:MAG: ABC transporter permease subunit [Bacillota bacterium]|nr:ABC transporter permease subunit [Bacillota bacterium]
MHKVRILYRNELYKIFRTRLMLIVVAALLVFPLLQQLGKRQSGGDDLHHADGSWKLDGLIAMYDERIAQTLDYARSEGEDTLYQALEVAVYDRTLKSYRELAGQRPEIAARNFALDLVERISRLEVWLDPEAAGIDLPAGLPADELFARQQEIIPGYFEDPSGLPRDRERAREQLTQLEAALADGSHQPYAEFMLGVLDEASAFGPESAGFYAGRRASYALLVKRADVSANAIYDPYYIENTASLLQEASDCEQSLAEGIDYTRHLPRALSPQRESAVRDRLAILRYKLDHDLISSSYDQNHGESAYLGSWMLVLFILAVYVGIVAASLISSEIESGSIKLLIIAPVKRWRIYAAKYLALITTIVTLSLLAWAWLQLLHLVIHGTQSMPVTVAARNGSAYLLPFALRNLLDTACFALKLLFYGSFAMMMSGLLRRTSVSVGIAVGVAFLDFMATFVSYNLGWQYWFQVMPFINLDIGNHFYPTLLYQSMSFLGMPPNSAYIPLWFMVLYVVGFLAIFIATGLQSLTKRDI